MKRLFLLLGIVMSLQSAWSANYTYDGTTWQKDGGNITPPAAGAHLALANGDNLLISVYTDCSYVDFAGNNNLTISGATANFFRNSALNVPTLAVMGTQGSMTVQGAITVSKFEKTGGASTMNIIAKTATGTKCDITTGAINTGDLTWIFECNKLTTTAAPTMETNTLLRIKGDFDTPGMIVKGEISVDGTFTTTSAVQMTTDGKITVGGSMSVTGNFNINTTATVTVGGNLTVGGQLTNDNKLTVGGNLLINSMQLNGAVPSVTTVSGNFTVSTASDQTLNGTLAVLGQISMSSNLSCNASAILTYYKTMTFAAGKSLNADCNGKLPISLHDFTAVQNGNSVLLQWETLSEENNKSFTVERSLEGTQFSAIDEKQGAGTTRYKTKYESIDQSPMLGINYYRLRQNDYDGAQSISKVVSVLFTKAQQATMEIVPSLVKSGESLHCVFGENISSGLEILSDTGAAIAYYSVQGNSTIAIDTQNLHSGIYYIRLTNTGQIKRFIVE